MRDLFSCVLNAKRAAETAAMVAIISFVKSEGGSFEFDKMNLHSCPSLCDLDEPEQYIYKLEVHGELVVYTDKHSNGVTICTAHTLTIDSIISKLLRYYFYSH